MALFSLVRMVICKVCGTDLAITLVQGYHDNYICEPCLRKNHVGGF